jgi:hypothetical protein
MFRSISANWELIKASAAVLRSDKELIVCPFISAVATLIVTATFAAPLFLAGIFSGITTGQRNPQVAGIVIGFLFYLVQNFMCYCTEVASHGGSRGAGYAGVCHRVAPPCSATVRALVPSGQRSMIMADRGDIQYGSQSSG